MQRIGNPLLERNTLIETTTYKTQKSIDYNIDAKPNLLPAYLPHYRSWFNKGLRVLETRFFTVGCFLSDRKKAKQDGDDQEGLAMEMKGWGRRSFQFRTQISIPLPALTFEIEILLGIFSSYRRMICSCTWTIPLRQPVPSCRILINTKQNGRSGG